MDLLITKDWSLEYACSKYPGSFLKIILTCIDEDRLKPNLDSWALTKGGLTD